MPTPRRLASLLRAAWVTILLTLSSAPDAGRPLDAAPFPYADKVAHGAGYALLGALHHAAGGRHVGLFAAIIGAIDEGIIQGIVPERHPDPLDVAADVAGAMIGAAALRLARRRREARDA
jgi:VanZ family protein